MSLFLLLVAVLVVGAVAAVATGRVEGGMSAPGTTHPHRPLPAGRVGAEDVDALRFTVGARGYRMDEVDAVLARLREEIADRDAQLAGRAGQPGQVGVAAAPEHAGATAEEA